MIIIKIGGGATLNLEGIVKGLSQLEGPKLIVHGANALRDEIAEQMGRPTQTILSASGYSSVRTDQEAMDIFMMSYPGLRNKHLVELCRMNGVNAIGLSGLDGGLIQGKRKKAIKARVGDKIKLVKDDLSGKPDQVNTNLLQTLLFSEYTPLICPPIAAEDGRAINTDNDTIVSLLVRELSDVEMVIHFFEAPGLMKDVSDPNSLIEKISQDELESAEEKYTQGRMKRKMLAVREAFDHGVKKVVFADGRLDDPISAVLEGKGTLIQAR